LFEWQVSEIVTDPPYEVRFDPSPWIAKFGDSLEAGSYIFYQFDVSYCGNDKNPEKLSAVVRRSQSEKVLEAVTRNINHNIIPWLLLLLSLCGIYIWWYAIHYKRPITETFGFMTVALVLSCILLVVGRPFLYSVGSLGCLDGTVIFNAKLSKIHYETLFVFLAAILADVMAVGIILRELRRAGRERRVKELADNHTS
jgi:hypothetical protein